VLAAGADGEDAEQVGGHKGGLGLDGGGHGGGEGRGCKRSGLVHGGIVHPPGPGREAARGAEHAHASARQPQQVE
ncbi:unnamed protein product, partial [Ectocarpus sp. 8 AP-2014]